MIYNSILYREREDLKAIEFSLYGPPAPLCLPSAKESPFVWLGLNERETIRLKNRLYCERYYRQQPVKEF